MIYADTALQALKVDQMGYHQEGPKYGYIGAWMGFGGAMDVEVSYCCVDLCIP
jgi:hypothetical protein